MGTKFKLPCDGQRMALLVLDGEDGWDGVICRHDTEKDRSVIVELDYLDAVKKHRVEDDDQTDGPGGRKTRRAARKPSEASA